MNNVSLKTDYAYDFSQGDEAALAFFYMEFLPALTYYSFGITKNRFLSENIASEAFVKTWPHHHKLNNYKVIKAYLYKVVHRESIRAVKNEIKRNTKNGLIPTTKPEETHLDLLIKSEVYQKIYTELKELPPATQRVMIMYYFQGKKTAQIAKELNLHNSTIQTQRLYGLKLLKKKAKNFSWFFNVVA